MKYLQVKFLVCFLVILPLFHSGILLADTDCTPPNTSEACVEVGQWQFGLALGLGIRTNPVFEGDDIPLVLLPSFSYYGERFFIENLEIGYTLFESQTSTFNLITSPAYDRVFFERWDLSNFFYDLASGESLAPPTISGDSGLDRPTVGVIRADEIKSRKLSWLGGFEFAFSSDLGDFQASLLADLSDVHNGKEFRLAYSLPLGESSWRATLGLTWKDEDFSQYYYGVGAVEVVDDRAAYQTGDSVNPFIRLHWQQKTDNNNAWRFSLEYQRLDRSIWQSPLLEEKQSISLFVGKQYQF